MANEKEYFINYENKSTSDHFQSIYVDAQNQYGIQLYYIPLDEYNDDQIDAIWGEIQQKNYSKMYGMRMLAEDQGIMQGQGNFFSKVGLQTVDESTFYTTRKEFIERITGKITRPFDGGNQNIDDKRPLDDGFIGPKIADLIYVPMWNSLFKVDHVEDNENLMNGFRGMWKLECSKYKIDGNETIDIDKVNNSASQVNAENTQEIVDAINEIDDNELARIEEATETNVGETGFGENKKDEVINDNVAVETQTLRDDTEDGGSDIFSDW